jgi:hypothetical protein
LVLRISARTASFNAPAEAVPASGFRDGASSADGLAGFTEGAGRGATRAAAAATAGRTCGTLFPTAGAAAGRAAAGTLPPASSSVSGTSLRRCIQRSSAISKW